MQTGRTVSVDHFDLSTASMNKQYQHTQNIQCKTKQTFRNPSKHCSTLYDILNLEYLKTLLLFQTFCSIAFSPTVLSSWVHRWSFRNQRVGGNEWEGELKSRVVMGRDTRVSLHSKWYVAVGENTEMMVSDH